MQERLLKRKMKAAFLHMTLVERRNPAQPKKTHFISPSLTFWGNLSCAGQFAAHVHHFLSTYLENGLSEVEVALPSSTESGSPDAARTISAESQGAPTSALLNSGASRDKP